MAPRTSPTRRQGGWGAGRPLQRQVGRRPWPGARPARVRGAQRPRPCWQQLLARRLGLSSVGAEQVRRAECGRRWPELVPSPHAMVSVSWPGRRRPAQAAWAGQHALGRGRPPVAGDLGGAGGPEGPRQ
eukprot:11517243-Alexandrium_andersonii.AAC.1